MVVERATVPFQPLEGTVVQRRPVCLHLSFAPVLGARRPSPKLNGHAMHRNVATQNKHKCTRTRRALHGCMRWRVGGAHRIGIAPYAVGVGALLCQHRLRPLAKRRTTSFGVGAADTSCEWSQHVRDMTLTCPWLRARLYHGCASCRGIRTHVSTTESSSNV